MHSSYKKFLPILVGIVALGLIAAWIYPKQHSKAAGEAVNVWLTTSDLSTHLAQQASINFAPGNGTASTSIAVNDGITYQQMDGFGASFTDSSAWLVYNKMSASQRTALMNNLFSSSSGIGLSFLRQPMGASDLTLPSSGEYSYDDMPAGQTDTSLSHFSISHDTAYIIPVLKQALQINPNLKIMGTPWSPPGWMKSTGSMEKGTLNSSAYTAYANYFVKYIQAYQAQGLPIYAVTLQNEPLYQPDGYPGMSFPATDETNFIKNNLGPAFASNGITTKILGYDHNWDQSYYPLTILGDATANKYTAGTAWHCYGGTADAQSQVHNSYPTKDAYLTECSAGTTWNVGFPNVMDLLINGTRNWAKTIVRWGMALDPNHGPNLGTGAACNTCIGIVTVDQNTGNVTYNSDYYGLGHASKFLAAGAYRIDSSAGGNGIEDVAFKNPDGSKVLVAYNSSSSSQAFNVQWNGEYITYTLPAGAAATFTWSGAQTNGIPLDRTGWTATASSTPTDSCCTGDVPANALDGDSATRWSSGVAQAANQWFQVDMKATKSFNSISLDAGSSTGDYPHGYQVFVSSDGSNWGSAVASGSGTGQLVTITFATQSARYIKVVQTSSSGSWWSIHEFNVYGTAAPTSVPTNTPTTGTTLNRSGWSATASSNPTDPCCTGDVPANALDGNVSTRWSSGVAQAANQWFQVDMKATKSFNSISLDAGTSTGDYPHGYQVFVSNDGANWGSTVASGSGTSQLVTISFATQSARYIKVVQTSSSGNWWSIHEFNVYGATASTVAPTQTATNTPTASPTQPPASTPTNTPQPPANTPTQGPTQPPASGLVINGGFEAGNTSGWTCDTGTAVVSSPVNNGNYALQLNPTDSLTGQCTQTIAVQANHSYTLSAYVQGNYAYLGVNGGASTWTNSSGYTKLSVPFTTSTGQTSITIFVHGWYSQGSIYIDDVTLQ
jgi:glucosylceramidase